MVLILLMMAIISRPQFADEKFYVLSIGDLSQRYLNNYSVLWSVIWLENNWNTFCYAVPLFRSSIKVSRRIRCEWSISPVTYKQQAGRPSRPSLPISSLSMSSSTSTSGRESRPPSSAGARSAAACSMQQQRKLLFVDVRDAERVLFAWEINDFSLKPSKHPVLCSLHLCFDVMRSSVKN